eukprot:scpid103006/ scgid1727/ 
MSKCLKSGADHFCIFYFHLHKNVVMYNSRNIHFVKELDLKSSKYFHFLVNKLITRHCYCPETISTGKRGRKASNPRHESLSKSDRFVLHSVQRTKKHQSDSETSSSSPSPSTTTGSEKAKRAKHGETGYYTNTKAQVVSSKEEIRARSAISPVAADDEIFEEDASNAADSASAPIPESVRVCYKSYRRGAHMTQMLATYLLFNVERKKDIMDTS